MSEEIDPSHSGFWGQVVPAGETVSLDMPSQCTLTITQAVIPDVTKETQTGPVRLFATVKTLIPDDEEEEKPNAEETDLKYTESELLLATLQPFTSETVSLNHLFSPLNIVKFQNKGKLDIHLSGVVEYLENEEEEDEEEEKAEEKEVKEEKEEN